MDAWFKAHTALGIGLILGALIMFWAGPFEILDIIADEEGKKARRIAKRVLTATAFIGAMSSFVAALALAIFVSKTNTRLAIAIVGLITFTILGGPIYAVLAARERDRHDRTLARKRLGGAALRAFYAPALLLCLYLLYNLVQWVRQITK